MIEDAKLGDLIAAVPCGVVEAIRIDERKRIAERIHGILNDLETDRSTMRRLADSLEQGF